MSPLRLLHAHTTGEDDYRVESRYNGLWTIWWYPSDAGAKYRCLPSWMEVL